MQSSFVKYFALLTIVVCGMMACTKDRENIPVPVPPPGTKPVLLKEVVAQHLPSPYFQLKYDDSGYATHLNFASNLFTYVFTYENKRIQRMTNTINGNYLLYAYENSRVSNIQRIDGTNGKTLWKYDFTYYSSGQLKQVRWFRFPGDGSDSILERKVRLIYDANGNLAEYDDLRNDPVIGISWSQTVEFSQYDEGVNVSEFYLLKDFFEDVIYLPQVKLQKNNPGRVTMTGLVNDYELVNTYQYNSKNLPLTKTTRMKQVRGAGSGQEVILTDHYSYY